MTYGEHTALVEEVIEFAFGGRVLFAVGAAEETPTAWITDDLSVALEANAGEGESSRFRMASHQDVSGWGNTGLLGHNLTTGDDLRIEDVAEELSWGWHDLTENLVAELIWTEAYWQRPDRKTLHDALFKRFLGSSLESELHQRLGEILPAAEPLPGWQNCAEHLANNMVTELWYCAENRAFNGQTDNFWELMFRQYQQGVWPCGWRGEFPSPGKFVVYRRRAEPLSWPTDLTENEIPGSG